ncbi:hypothetical protein [Streptomyces sp. NPDC047453]|uniref:hypothetical protein n=1 Tax=Streptomyces sp. NPDC047453 TaxID=3154812 RepID=UPI0034118787
MATGRWHCRSGWTSPYCGPADGRIEVLRTKWAELGRTNTPGEDSSKDDLDGASDEDMFALLDDELGLN